MELSSDVHHGQKLKGRVAVVTGGARGIGAAAAKMFAQHGAHVVIADILDDLGISLAESIGGKYIHCDVSQESDMESAVDLAVTWKGKLDIMFSNAGVSGPGGSISKLEMKKVKELLDVNVMGMVHAVKYAGRAMINQKRGCIICTSSSAALLGGLASHAYTISKEAILGLMRSAACELGIHGIRVNCISPHGVPSEILVSAYRKALGKDVQPEEVGKMIGERGSILHGKWGSLENIAETALFLASDGAGFITGHNLVVDGGFTSAYNLMPFLYN